MRKKISGCFDDSYCYINKGKKFVLKNISRSDKKVVSPNSSTIFTIDYDKKSINNKITVEICIYLITNKYKLEILKSNTSNIEDFILIIIKDIFLFLRNETNCLNKLNLSDLKKLPHIIYSITKENFNIEENEIKEIIKNLYGFIYLARNQVCKNKKVYVGQTIRTIEIEWGEIYGKGIRLRKKRLENPSRSNSTRYILNAIAKYPDDAWNLRLIDIAYSKSELDILERYYILDVYDSMNSEKGYNLTTGGRTGGRLSNRTKVQVSKRVKEIWNTPGYKERLSKSQKETWIKGDRREKWIKAAYKSWENKERREEARKITTINWKNDEIRKKRIIGLKAASKKLWNNPSEAMLNNLKKLHQNSRKEICNIEAFLKDIKNTKYQRDFLQGGDLYDKYEIKSHMTLNKAIKKILGGFGVKNHGEAHRFFYDRSFDEVLKYLDNPISYNIFKDPLTKQFFFDVLNSEKGSDLHIKYKVWHKNGLIIKIKRIVGKFGINNYSELKWFLQDNGLEGGLQMLIELG